LERIKIQTRASGNHDDNSHSTVVYLCYDESAHLKRRPLNERANHYIANSHEPDTKVFGDVFIVRLKAANQEPVSLAVEDLDRVGVAAKCTPKAPNL